MRIVGAKAAVDRASALDHVGLAANEREQRSFIGSEAAPADWRVEDGDTACLRALLERLDGVGLGRRGHRDDRAGRKIGEQPVDRKSTRLNSSHLGISYAVFCLKKKK